MIFLQGWRKHTLDSFIIPPLETNHKNMIDGKKVILCGMWVCPCTVRINVWVHGLNIEMAISWMLQKNLINGEKVTVLGVGVSMLS